MTNCAPRGRSVFGAVPSSGLAGKLVQCRLVSRSHLRECVRASFFRVVTKRRRVNSAPFEASLSRKVLLITDTDVERGIRRNYVTRLCPCASINPRCLKITLRGAINLFLFCSLFFSVVYFPNAVLSYYPQGVTFFLTSRASIRAREQVAHVGRQIRSPDRIVASTNETGGKKQKNKRRRCVAVQPL